MVTASDLCHALGCDASTFKGQLDTRPSKVGKKSFSVWMPSNVADKVTVGTPISLARNSVGSSGEVLWKAWSPARMATAVGFGFYNDDMGRRAIARLIKRISVSVSDGVSGPVLYIGEDESGQTALQLPDAGQDFIRVWDSAPSAHTRFGPITNGFIGEDHLKEPFKTGFKDLLLPDAQLPILSDHNDPKSVIGKTRAIYVASHITGNTPDLHVIFDTVGDDIKSRELSMGAVQSGSKLSLEHVATVDEGQIPNPPWSRFICQYTPNSEVANTATPTFDEKTYIRPTAAQTSMEATQTPDAQTGEQSEQTTAVPDKQPDQSVQPAAPTASDSKMDILLADIAAMKAEMVGVRKTISSNLAPKTKEADKAVDPPKSDELEAKRRKIETDAMTEDQRRFAMLEDKIRESDANNAKLQALIMGIEQKNSIAKLQDLSSGLEEERRAVYESLLERASSGKEPHVVKVGKEMIALHEQQNLMKKEQSAFMQEITDLKAKLAAATAQPAAAPPGTAPTAHTSTNQPGAASGTNRSAGSKAPPGPQPAVGNTKILASAYDSAMIQQFKQQLAHRGASVL